MGLHQRYARLLSDAPNVFMAGRKEREEEIRKQLSVLFEGMMKAVYKTEGAQLSIDILSTPQVREFIDSHASVLDSSFETVEMSDAMRRRLQRSDWIFSGMKTFHELNEAFPSLIDENGDRKSFERFLNDVRSIDQTSNSNYLRAEYNFVTASAQMAAKWEGFMQDGDRYNLQYRTQKDDKVRPEHAALDGVTLPPSDSFWAEFYPPNGWNCRCNVVQVRKSKYPATPHDEAMRLGDLALQRDSKGIFRFNPGLEQSTVPAYNPYTIRRCRHCDIAKGKSKLSRLTPPDNQLCKVCQYLHDCNQLKSEMIPWGKGTIEISDLVNRKDNDFDKLIQVAKHFASQGKEVFLSPKMTRPSRFDYNCIYGTLKGTIYDGKCPDLRIGEHWYEHEGFISSNPKNAFRNMMGHGLLQSDRLIIDRPDLTERYMLRSVLGRIEKGENIQEVWLREKDGELTLLYKKTDG